MNLLINQILEIGYAIYSWGAEAKRELIATIKENEFMSAIITIGAIISGIIWLFNRATRR